MNFSTHIARIAESVRDGLNGRRAELIARLREGLAEARELLKTDSFDYWIRQVDETPPEEIATTVYGVTEARRMWEPLPNSRSSFEIALSSTCEAVLSYCAEDDMCEAQGDYHYYVHLPTGAVFKESTLGGSPDRPEESISESNTRVARVSELSIPAGELYD